MVSGDAHQRQQNGGRTNQELVENTTDDQDHCFGCPFQICEENDKVARVSWSSARVHFNELISNCRSDFNQHKRIVPITRKRS